jgi:hypothetical protein
VLVALTAAVAATATAATAAPRVAAPTIPVTGATQTGGVLTGVATITGFAVNSAGQLVATGTLSGTLTDATGAVTTITDTVFSTVLTPSQATGPGCQILDLVLGPIHLDLLGLVVTTNQIHLNITAFPGPGNLLGNLLCAVVHLLDGPSGMTVGAQNLVNVLNRLLAGA